MRLRSFNFQGARVGALLNTSSGGCDARAEADLTAAFAGAGVEIARIWCGSGSELGDALASIARTRLDALVVLAGDGTIGAAGSLAARRGFAMLPLPGGTMNRLPKALYGDLSWREVLRDTLAAPRLRAVPGGVVGGRHFFVSAMFGDATRIAQTREAIRGGDLVGAVRKGVRAVTRREPTPIGYRIGRRRGEADVIAVLCPLNARRLRRDARVLEAAAVKLEGLGGALRLGVEAAFGEWRKDPDVVCAAGRTVRLEAAFDLPALIDGEACALGRSAEITAVPHAFDAICPAAR